MSFTKKLSFLVLVPAFAAAFAGCQQTDVASNRKTGTYAGARHSMVGSNIPQRESVDATGATYDPNQFSNFQNNQANMSRGGALGGGGVR